MAVGKFTLYSMRRHLSSYGNVSLSEFIGGKISTYETHFPKGITTNFMVSLVLDYLEENAVPSYWMYLMMNFNHSNVIMNTILLMLFVVIVMNKSLTVTFLYVHAIFYKNFFGSWYGSMFLKIFTNYWSKYCLTSKMYDIIHDTI